MVARKSSYIRWYTDEDGAAMAHQNALKYSYPQAIGAIDGTHIPITPPADGYADFICRKQYPSIVLQAVVDGNYFFRDIYANTPGSSHDAAVFHRSPLSTYIDTRMPTNDIELNGITVPLHILGDPAYPISPNVMKGFTGRNLLPSQQNFNYYLSSARMCVEIAFGRLMSRWRILHKRVDAHYICVPEIVTTCCMLHNLCEQYKLPINEAELHDRNIEFLDPPQPNVPNIRKAMSSYLV
jgi:hypothetical protein